MDRTLIDFHQYASLFGNCYPSGELLIYSGSGDLVWHGEGVRAVPRTLGLPDWTRDVGGQLWQSSDAGELLAWPVTDSTDTNCMYLVVRSQVWPSEREAFYAATAPSLQTIAFSIRTQLSLQTELDAMARELALRYDELNLIYNTDDEVRFLDEGRHALCSLVENCNEYLNVDVTAFLMPGLGMRMVQCSPECRHESGSLAELKVIDAVKTAPRTVVFNDPEETRSQFGFHGRMIASPVLDGNGNVAGALLILRTYESPEFVNSDRNLLIAMSGKASKIILSSYDSLTGLMRQEGFDRSLASALSRARHSNQQHVLLHVNVDRMHLINDTIGYQAGDRVLQAVAAELRNNLREADRIARLGGDEFGILVHGCSIREGELVAEKLCQAVAVLNVDCGGQDTDVSACIGVAALDKDSLTTVSAHASAEIACSIAKELGRNRWHVCRKDDVSLLERQNQMEWVGRLKEAIRNDEFCLYSQRLEPLSASTKGHHFEILIRMLDGDGSILPPSAFLPVAERYQMMPALDRWIVEHSLEALASHTQAMIEQNILCSINLSGQSLMDRNFADFVMDQFRSSGVPPSLICFEITETAAIANLENAKRFMHELKSQGCSFSLDDFGAGLSSFAYLRTLPVDYLKFDGSFVSPIADDETATAMLAAMNQIGQILGLRTVAEFVESDEIISRLKIMGVDYAQGFAISRPRPVAEEMDEINRVAATA